METATATITSAEKIPASETVKGTTTYTATFNKDWAATQTKDIQDIPVLAHTHAWGTVTYTWTTDGSSCTAKRVCTKDGSHVETATATITSAEKIPASETVKGTTTYTATFNKDWAATQTKDIQDIPVLAHTHAWGTVAYTWAADGSACAAKRVCSKNSSHIETATAVITDAVKTPATCTTMGTTTYTATFSKTWASTQTKDVQDIPATNHAWGTVTYTWAADGSACTAKRVCSKNSNHVETATATITDAVKTPATCTTMGTTTYTATFSKTWASTQTKDVQDIPVDSLAHVWGSVGYTWSEDGSSCVAKRVCTKDSGHVETATATITDAVKTPADCGVKGTTTYTATFAEVWAATQTKDVQDIPALVHNYGEWMQNGAYGHKRVCANNAGHVLTEAHAYGEDKTCDVCGYVYTVSAGVSASRYMISVEKADHGQVTSNARTAAKGSMVTITVKPDDGYELAELTVLDQNGAKIELTKKSATGYAFKMPAGNVTVQAAFAKAGAAGNDRFTDVPAGMYYYDAVLWAVENGITNGTTDTTFDPNAACTRAHAVTFLWRAAGSPAPKTKTTEFTDVVKGSYYYDAVLWAVENGITNGTTATTFNPHAPVTRAQNVTFMNRWAKASVKNAENPFADVSTGSYYYDAVLWAVENGITNGTTATTFDPNAACTRAQIVTFLYRYMG